MSFRRSFTCKPVCIPEPVKDISSDLATKIIEKENEVLKSASAELIQDLINCYSEAIEFYSSKNDLKYQDFQRRMHSLLSSPQVLKTLTGKSTTPQKNTKNMPLKTQEKNIKTVNKSQDSEKLINKTPETKPKSLENVNDSAFPAESSKNFIQDSTPILEYPGSGDVSPVSTCPSLPSPNHISGSSLRTGKTDHPFTFPSRSGKNIRIIVDRHASNTKETTSRAIKDFKSQDSALNHRLASRKKQMLTRSMTNSSFSRMDISDIVESPTHLENNEKGCFVIHEDPVEMDKFELLLEEIMEKNFAQRAVKIAEIKVKYEGQINEMSGMGDLMQMVVIQMKENMKKEIDTVVEEFDRNRREQIKILKESRGMYSY